MAKVQEFPKQDTDNFVSPLVRLNRFRNTVVDILLSWIITDQFFNFTQLQRNDFRAGYSNALSADREILAHLAAVRGATIFDLEEIDAARQSLAGILSHSSSGDYSYEYGLGMRYAERHSEHLERFYLSMLEHPDFGQELRAAWANLVGVVIGKTYPAGQFDNLFAPAKNSQSTK